TRAPAPPPAPTGGRGLGTILVASAAAAVVALAAFLLLGRTQRTATVVARSAATPPAWLGRNDCCVGAATATPEDAARAAGAGGAADALAGRVASGMKEAPVSLYEPARSVGEGAGLRALVAALATTAPDLPLKPKEEYWERTRAADGTETVQAHALVE